MTSRIGSNGQARLASAALALALACAGVAACGADAGSAGAGGAGGSSARESIRVVVVGHGQASDPFWSIVANGLDDAAADLGVEVEYQAPMRFDMVRMSNLIDAAIASRPSALIVSVPDADALGSSIRAAVSAGIPTISFNSGADAWRDLGVLAHVGQEDYDAGLAAGRRMAEAGVRRALCVNHEVGNLALDSRCRGLGDGLEAAGGSMRVLAIQLANPEDAQQRVGSTVTRESDIDGVLALGPGSALPTVAALRETGRLDEIAFATFDLAPEVLDGVRDGEILFAIDQQPYLQGYLSVVAITKYLETNTLPGGGEIVRTGPSFVTRDEAERLIPLSDQGIR